MPKPEFKEIGRVKLTDSEDAVLSEMRKPGTKEVVAYYLNKDVKSEGYSGPTKGIRIPEDLFVEFIKIFPQEFLKAAVDD